MRQAVHHLHAPRDVAWLARTIRATREPYSRLQIRMVEGHQCHRVAHAHRKALLGRKFEAYSPNKRFADGMPRCQQAPGLSGVVADFCSGAESVYVSLMVTSAGE